MLNAIVFDMDGTLWQTGASYIYAYHKLCDYFGTAHLLSDEAITRCLGQKLEQALAYLFPGREFTHEDGVQAVQFSAEYLYAHPDDCCFPGVQDLLRQLSRDYAVYIVSNCPRAYADAFLQISGTREDIRRVYTIEDGSKQENVAKIASQTDGKLLFVGDSTDDLDALTDPYTQYFCYARYGYKPCNRYDYAINALTELPGVIEKLNIKERQAGGAPYRVISRGDNQLTLIQKDDDTAYFGFVHYADREFDAVVQELKASCTKRLLGPINFNTYYPYRFAIDHFDWRLYPDCGGQEALPVFLENGFKIHQEYGSALVGIDHAMRAKARRAKLSAEYRVEVLQRQAVYGKLEDIYAVAAESFSQAYLYEPISCRDFLDIYMQSLAGIAPDLVIIYRHDLPIAFCFCYEDPEKRFYVCKTIGMKKHERNSNVVLTLLDRSFGMMEARGYQEVLLHFRNLKTRDHLSLFKRTMIKQKKYALLELSHDQ